MNYKEEKEIFGVSVSTYQEHEAEHDACSVNPTSSVHELTFLTAKEDETLPSSVLHSHM